MTKQSVSRLVVWVKEMMPSDQIIQEREASNSWEEMCMVYLQGLYVSNAFEGRWTGGEAILG